MGQIFLALDSSQAGHLVLRLSTSSQNYDAPTEARLESDLIPAVDSLLSQAGINLENIDAFVLGQGPGSFMGLRLGFSVFRTWAWIYDKEIICVSSLDLLVRSFPQHQHLLFVPCIEAKMQKVFANIQNHTQKLLEDCDILPQTLQAYLTEYRDYAIIGSGAELLKELLPDPTVIYPNIEILPHCFSREFLNSLDKKSFSKKSNNFLEPIQPNYLRLSAAETTLLENQKKDLS
ncbi:MAG: tRNA (adenosine(37)-N6)-threonylcarbamoyltransferase complex dimerization subunit type 1 TsaB [Brevinema sp.]